MKRIVILFVLVFVGNFLMAQTDTTTTEDYLDMSLEELMDMELNVASGQVALTARESPGIISVVTAEEIQNSGARDLIDVLRLVPRY